MSDDPAWSLRGEFTVGGQELTALEALLDGTGYRASVVARDGAPGWSGWTYWIVLDVPDDAPIAARVREFLRVPPRPA